MPNTGSVLLKVKYISRRYSLIGTQICRKDQRNLRTYLRNLREKFQMIQYQKLQFFNNMPVTSANRDGNAAQFHHLGIIRIDFLY